MILVSAFKKYFALDDKQKEFIKTGNRIFMTRPAELLKFLQPLAKFDQECDAARGQAGKIMFGCFLLGILLIILLAAEVLPQMLAPVLLVPAFVFVLTLVAYLILKSVDIHNNLREFVVPVLNTISQDMEPNEKIRVKIDLRGKCIAAKKLRTEKNDPGWFSYPKTTKNFYKDVWFDGSANLYDGSRLFFSVTDMVTHTHVYKKNRRGNKVKSKNKYKIKSVIKTGLALKNKDYVIQESAELTGAGDRVKQKQGNRRNVISLTRVELSNSLETALEPVSMLALIGKILMSARPAAKQE